ncbi:hypothetical protein CCAN12_810088 [Capnocytophaga canimorsus]|uniref:Uncharacterized protein n=1 Tax=Capnocytophaga canimorsus TaxID=28188 RepID=A0A0B7HQF1_9FLAO|nr:hypothetical protein CCAN12_810088 [Capnocytophaga canimorsus]
MKTPVVWIVGGVDKGNDYSPPTALRTRKSESNYLLRER